jgi:ABC-2 type transport system ATP-binding protein
MNVVIINVKNLWFRYSRSTDYILKSFTFQKKDSTTIGLLGVNGCGKTTLLKLLAGIISPSKGEIRIIPSEKNNRKISKRILYIPENARLFLIGPTLRKDLNRVISDQKSVNQLLEDYDLTFIADKKLYNLSEGQRRLSAIFVAFQIPSKLILLDEPTIGLDQKGRQLLFNLFKEAKKQQKIVFVSTNDSRIFPNLDELIVIRNGILFQRGSPKDVLYRLEEETELIPNQIPRLIISLERQLNQKLPHCLNPSEMNDFIEEWRIK